MFHVVLIEPEIPQNTGSIGRLCLATNTALHLIEPLGFEINDTRLKRAGLDYWEHLAVTRYPSWEAFEATVSEKNRLVFFTKKAGPTLFQYSVPENAYLVLGKETAGISDSILNRYGGQCVRIPLFDARVRSLNLANAASIAVYESLRQHGQV